MSIDRVCNKGVLDDCINRCVTRVNNMSLESGTREDYTTRVGHVTRVNCMDVLLLPLVDRVQHQASYRPTPEVSLEDYQSC